MNDNDTIEYGRATAADLPAVVELCMLVEAQHEAYWKLRWERRPGLEEGYLAWLGHRLKDSRMLIEVARLHGEVVGMILVTIQKEVPIYTYDEYAFVQDMAVREGHRRQGIAQRLLTDAGAWTKEQGLNQLRLMVADHNPTAHRAFQKVGFLPAYHEMVLPVEDNIKQGGQI